jgi:SAM-dependent methyltransferase
MDREQQRRLGAWYTPHDLVDFVFDRALTALTSRRPPQGDESAPRPTDSGSGARSDMAAGCVTAADLGADVCSVTDAHAVEKLGVLSKLRILDPACGDGRFLAAAHDALGPRAEILGVDLDPGAVAAARLAVPAANVTEADALAFSWSPGTFDLIIGNPPFLGQMTSLTSRGGRSSLGGGAYADTAALFLSLAHQLAKPDGGIIALVLPQSILATRDAGPIRAAVTADAALTDLWVAGEAVFDAAVHTVVAVFQRGRPQGLIRRWFGPNFDPVSPATVRAYVQRRVSSLAADVVGIGWPAVGAVDAQGHMVSGAGAVDARGHLVSGAGAVDVQGHTVSGSGAVRGVRATAASVGGQGQLALEGERLLQRSDGETGRLGGESWSFLTADLAGVPQVSPETGGVLGDIATVTADFRDQYYGLVGAVGDDVDGPPLITSGLIDAAVCHWGAKPTRFAKVRYQAPRVNVAALSPALQTWAAARLVPKVLMATQTKVIEAIADPQGELLPSVPVLSIVPRNPDDVWSVLAVVLAPSTSAWAATAYLGAGMTSNALKLSAAQARTIPLPAHPWADAIAPLRAGDFPAFARAMNRAYAVPDEPVTAWWLARI